MTPKITKNHWEKSPEASNELPKSCTLILLRLFVGFIEIINLSAEVEAKKGSIEQYYAE